MSQIDFPASSETLGVEIRRKNSDLMHLKSYQIDGRLLRTGAANFSAPDLSARTMSIVFMDLNYVLAVVHGMGPAGCPLPKLLAIIGAIGLQVGSH
jgi:hypothetical protein